MRVGGGGDCLKYVKGGWNRKERRRDKLGQGVGPLKRGRDGNPLTNYEVAYLVTGLD